MATQTVDNAATNSADRKPKMKGWKAYIEADLGFRNHWYPIASSESVKEGETFASQLCGERIILTRINGELKCMRDRCMHRGVPFSKKPECLIKNSISCWYHGWTFDWDSGELVTIISNPSSSQIGKHTIRTFPATDLHGLVFVYMGDGEPGPIEKDVPPGFADQDQEVGHIMREVDSNWRVGAENGFDSGHIWIHKHSKLVKGNDLALPLGFAPPEGTETYDLVLDEDGPKGVFDLIGERSMPVFEAYHGEDLVAEGHYGETRIANSISIWLPGVLKVDPFPSEDLIQYEWYVPIDEKRHIYVQTLARKVETEDDRAAFRKEFKEKWVDLALHGFNDDDVWAREAGEEFYSDLDGWTEERLYEPDMAIVEWRKVASHYNNGVQTKRHIIEA